MGQLLLLPAECAPEQKKTTKKRSKSSTPPEESVQQQPAADEDEACSEDSLEFDQSSTTSSRSIAVCQTASKGSPSSSSTMSSFEWSGPSDRPQKRARRGIVVARSIHD